MHARPTRNWPELVNNGVRPVPSESGSVTVVSGPAFYGSDGPISVLSGPVPPGNSNVLAVISVISVNYLRDS